MELTHTDFSWDEMRLELAPEGDEGQPGKRRERGGLLFMSRGTI